MAEHDLHTFMAQISAEMASEYERIYERATQDPGTAGDQGEQNWATLLREWLPPGYHVETKGRLISSTGELSPQVDVLVLKPSYPRKLLEKKIWLAGGVAAAFECKTTLKASHVRDAVTRCSKFKGLYPARTGSPYKELRSPLIYGLLAHSHSWKGDNSRPIENIQGCIGVGPSDIAHPREQIDFICVADLATWSSMYISHYEASWSPAKEFLEAGFQGSAGVMTSMGCYDRTFQNQTNQFQPVGALLGLLWQRLAWEDSTLRELADYFRLTKVWGSGQGQLLPWPYSVLSDGVASLTSPQGFGNVGTWDEWKVGGF